MTIMTAHGAGNTFVVLIDADASRRLSEDLARDLCAAAGPLAGLVAEGGAAIDGAIRVAPVTDGTVIALDPTMSTRAVAARLCWELYSTTTAHAIGGDSPIIIHQAPNRPTQFTTDLHLIHQEIAS
jgi:hypothetical protein